MSVFRSTAFSDPRTARRSLAAETVVREPVALGVLHREFYTEAGGTGELGNAMLNDVLAVGVASAVVVVIATILGAVELLWKAVAAIGGP
jgi:hypothetical protein